MSGYPAGLEYESDEDFDDEFEPKFAEPTLASFVSSNNPSDAKSSSIFNPGNQMNMKELEEQISLTSEDMRMSILKEDVGYVKKALENGFAPETLMQSGWTALMYAADTASNEIISLLLEKQANPNFQKDLFTPLMALCNTKIRNEDKLEACAKLLIDAGARVNVHDRHVMTPLMYASKLGYAKLVTLLCDAKADLNIQDTQGWTALSFAAANGFSHVVRVLLKYNCNYQLTSFDGQVPADLAFTHGFTMLADMLQKYDGDNLEQFHSLPDKSDKTVDSTSKYVKYGDLELFLYGLDLGHLIPLMQEHHLDFQDLLKLTDAEMVEVGITQLGVRKKLLESIRDVHTNEWDLSSLSKEQITKMATLEVSAVVANIAKHLQVINSSVKYVHKHVECKYEELNENDTAVQKSLVDQCTAAVQASKTLHTDIQGFCNDTIRMFPNANRKPINLIEGDAGQNRHLLLKLVPLGLLVVTGFCFVSYKISRR